MASGRRRVEMTQCYRRIGWLVLFSVGVVTLKITTLSSNPQIMDSFVSRSSITFPWNAREIPEPEILARRNDYKMRRNLKVIHTVPKLRRTLRSTRQMENEKKQDGPGSDGQNGNNSDKSGKSNNDKMQGDNADKNYVDKNDENGPDKQRNSNENFESNSNGADQGNEGNSTATNTSVDQADYSALTANSDVSKNSKVVMWVCIVLGLSLLGSTFVWTLVSTACYFVDASSILFCIYSMGFFFMLPFVLSYSLVMFHLQT
jgi:hypothetical protein